MRVGTRWATAAILLSASGLAEAEPGAAARHLLSHAHRAPDVLAACGSVAQLHGELDAPRSDTAELMHEAAGRGVPGWALGELLRHPDRPGVDAQRSIALAAWSDGSHRVEFPWSGSREQVVELLNELSGVVATHGEHWMIVRNGIVAQVSLEEQVLVLSSAEGQATAQGRGLPAPALYGEALDASCLVLRGEDALSTVRVKPFAPGSPERLRVAGPLTGRSLGAATVPRVSGSTQAAPDVVLTAAASWPDLVRALWPSGAPAWTELPRQLHPEHALSLASFGRGPDAELVVAVAVSDRRGRAMSAPALRRQLQSLSADGLLRTEGAVYRSPEDERWVGVGDGLLVLGTHPELVAEAARGEGVAWLDDTLGSLARQAPVAARVADVHFTGRVAGAAWELEPIVPGAEPDGAAWSAMFAAVAGRQHALSTW